MDGYAKSFKASVRTIFNQWLDIMVNHGQVQNDAMIHEIGQFCLETLDYIWSRSIRSSTKSSIMAPLLLLLAGEVS